MQNYNGATDHVTKLSEFRNVNLSLVFLSDKCTSDIVLRDGDASNVNHSKVLLALFIIFYFHFSVLEC